MNAATAKLLELATHTAATDNQEMLLHLLRAGHQHWCAGLAEVQADVTARCAELDDRAVQDWCTRAGAPWEDGTDRKEAVFGLAFAVWDSTPAAIAYTAMATHAAKHGVSLIPG